MKIKLSILLLVMAFIISMPFIFNKSVTVTDPHKLDADGNFILNEWVPSRDGDGPDWDYNLKPVQVSDRVWCFFGAMEMPTKENAGSMSNICYIKGDEEWIAWDSGPSYKYTEQAYAKMKEIADMPVKTVLVSHEHDDHWLGNNFFKEKFDAHIIGPASINENYYGPRLIDGKDYPGMQTRMIKALYQNAIRNTVLLPVDESPTEGSTKYEVSGVKMEYVNVGYSHSEEDFFLYLPDDKIILAGDLVMNGRVTSNRDGLIIGQINALKEIKARDWNYLVPGHGFTTDHTSADEAIKYFGYIKDRVLEGIEEEVDPNYITKIVTLEEYRDKDLYYLLSPGNVFRAYEELEMYEGDEEEDEDDDEEEVEEKEVSATDASAKEEKETAGEKSIPVIPVVSGASVAQDIQIYTTDNTDGKITAKTIEKIFNDSGFYISANNDMNVAFNSKFKATNHKLYHLFTLYKKNLVLELVKITPDAALVAPLSMSIYTEKDSNDISVSSLTLAGMAKVTGIPANNKYMVEYSKLVKETLVKALPNGKFEKTSYSILKPESDLVSRFKGVMEIESADAIEDELEGFQDEFEGSVETLGFVVAGFNKLGDEFKEAGYDKYDFFDAYSICKLPVIFEVAKTHPEAGAFAPCTLYMYKEKGSNEIHLAYPSVYNWISSLDIKDEASIKILIDAQKQFDGVINEVTE